jgi:hypothetical protein
MKPENKPCYMKAALLEYASQLRTVYTNLCTSSSAFGLITFCMQCVTLAFGV